MEGETMKHRTVKWLSLTLTLAALMFLAACHKKQPPPPPAPPPPPPAAPTASISANPETIQSGQSTSLTWQTSNATDVSIDPMGAVQPNGSQSVSPTSSTTYTLTAKGAGGTQTATTRVTVTPAPPPPPPPPTISEEELFSQNVKDIYFDYDKSDIRADMQSAMAGDIAFLTQHPNIHFEVGGYCDERGSTEYNLALGDSRANSVKNALVQGGVNAANITTRSYGKEKPFCTEHTEACWQENRRGHFVYQK
jgi:peptidoglycan-associated lipoprotein